MLLFLAHHHQVMDIYKQELCFKPRFITGRENDRQKAEAVSAFMEGKTSLCCISLRSASGLNLQRATCVVFGELDWSPAGPCPGGGSPTASANGLSTVLLLVSQGPGPGHAGGSGLKVSQFVSLMGTGRGIRTKPSGAPWTPARVRDLVRQLQSEDWTG